MDTLGWLWLAWINRSTRFSIWEVFLFIRIHLREVFHTGLVTLLWLLTIGWFNETFSTHALSANKNTLGVGVAVLAKLLALANRSNWVVETSVSIWSLAGNTLS
jgi:hypothetical protein